MFKLYTAVLFLSYPIALAETIPVDDTVAIASSRVQVT